MVSHAVPVRHLERSQVAFVSGREGNGAVYVMNADGSGQRRLTHTAGRDSHAAWSPDGRQIVFHSRRGGTIDVSVVNADGSGQRVLMRGARLPAWSPDGRRIALERSRDGFRDVYVVNADGSGLRRLTRNPEKTSVTDFAWSPGR